MAKEEITIEGILETIICRLYGFEVCGGDWMPECEDSTAPECKHCCQGKKVLADLKKLREA